MCSIVKCLVLIFCCNEKSSVWLHSAIRQYQLMWYLDCRDKEGQVQALARSVLRQVNYVHCISRSSIRSWMPWACSDYFLAWFGVPSYGPICSAARLSRLWRHSFSLGANAFFVCCVCWSYQRSFWNGYFFLIFSILFAFDDSRYYCHRAILLFHISFKQI